MKDSGFTTLDKIQPGEKGFVERIDSTSFPLKLRLLEMGLTKGMLVEVIRFAPMGDPIDILVRGYHLSLRRAEAEAIVLQKALLENEQLEKVNR
jgi:ferrous iron transport protein A